MSAKTNANDDQNDDSEDRIRIFSSKEAWFKADARSLCQKPLRETGSALRFRETGLALLYLTAEDIGCLELSFSRHPVPRKPQGKNEVGIADLEKKIKDKEDSGTYFYVPVTIYSSIDD